MSKEHDNRTTNRPTAEVYEIAIRFARIWGVVETLETFSNPGFDKIRDIVVAFAEEYISSGEEDFEGFFCGKLDEIRKMYKSSDFEGGWENDE